MSVANRCRRGHDHRPYWLAVRRLPRAERLDGNLEQPNRGAERPGDEVQLVLDDEVGWTKAADWVHRRGRVAVGRGVRGLDVALRVVRVHVAVPSAAAAHVTEQRRRLTLAREAGELVDGRDYEPRGEPVDLLVDGEHRQPLGDRPTFGERAPSEVVAAVDEHPPHRRVGLDLGCGDRGATPRAALDLEHGQPVRSVLVGLGELLVGFLEALWAHIGADP